MANDQYQSPTIEGADVANPFGLGGSPFVSAQNTVTQSPAYTPATQQNQQTQPAPKVGTAPKVGISGGSPAGGLYSADQNGLKKLLNLAKPTLDNNNKLIDQRNLVYKQLYTAPLSDEEKAALTPSTKLAIESGQRSLMESQIRAINSQLQGYTQGIDNSLQGYMDSVAKMQDFKKDVVKELSSNPGSAMLYGYDTLNKMGIDVSSLGIGTTIKIPQGTPAAQNNNPGNLMFVGQEGATQGSPKYDKNGNVVGYWAKFLTPEAGYQALQRQIQLDASRGMTLSQFIHKYAPASENDTAKYIQDAIQATGATENTLISSIDPSAISSFMAKKESGSTLAFDQSASTTSDISGVGFTYAEAQKAAPGISQSDYSNAIQVVDGGIVPSELSKRAASYSSVLAAANAYSMKKDGKPFSFAGAEKNYKFASNVQTQNTLNFLSSLVGNDERHPGGGNLDELVSQSDNIPRTQLPPLNDTIAWSKLKTGDARYASYYAAATEVSDQVAKILQGGGSGGNTSDAKLKQAKELFDIGFTPDQVKAVASTLKTLLVNRKESMISGNPYLSEYSSSTDSTSGESAISDEEAKKVVQQTLNTSGTSSSSNFEWYNPFTWL